MHPKIVKYIDRHMGNAMKGNVTRICKMLEKNPEALLVDLGCDDGRITMQFCQAVGTQNVHGVEYSETERTRLACEKGVKIRYADLNIEIPFDDNTVDVIVSNQVIEHLHKPAQFIREIKRVLKPGGYAVVSTENAASWHNIFSLVMGWQMFSSTCFCEKAGCGNPLALWGQKDSDGEDPMGHLIIFSIPGLVELAKYFGFNVESKGASGYYPLPYWFANIDKRHGHYISIKARKPIEDTTE